MQAPGHTHCRKKAEFLAPFRAMESHPQSFWIGYRSHLGCGLRRNREVPARRPCETAPRPTVLCPNERGWPPDLFGLQLNLASAEPRVADVRQPLHPAIVPRTQAPKARGLQTSSAHMARAIPVVPLPEKDVLIDIEQRLIGTGDPIPRWKANAPGPRP